MQNNQPYYSPDPQSGQDNATMIKHKRTFSVSFLLSALCVAIAITVLLTYVFTARLYRDYYNERLAIQQSAIEEMVTQNSKHGADRLQAFAALFHHYSYYADEVSDEELINKVLKAYAAATGDPYAEYYTDEEYAELTASNVGEQVGIGITVSQDEITVGGVSYKVFRIDSIAKGSPADGSALRVGDYLYRFLDGEEYKTVNVLGYDLALTKMRGEKGSTATFSAFRLSSTQEYETVNVSIVRDTYETEVVTYAFAESDPTVGIVRIERFSYKTPTQFKNAIKDLQEQGAEKFVFDLRNNPGGDLQSIKAVMTYFLSEGDLILRAIDREGNAAASYYAEAKTLEGDYAPCSVSEEEIGMYADLDMTVLCNGSTASAAEVFVATMRDYGLATIVGETTFGKGIMQSYLPLSTLGDYTGYIKITTYAYVTKCEETYHEIGITPHVQVALSAHAQQYPIYSIPQAEDNQLQAAIAQLS